MFEVSFNDFDYINQIGFIDGRLSERFCIT